MTWLLDLNIADLPDLNQYLLVSNTKTGTLRLEACQICPNVGEWYSPSNEMEKRNFNKGDVMPEIKDNPWGLTIWYLTE